MSHVASYDWLHDSLGDILINHILDGNRRFSSGFAQGFRKLLHFVFQLFEFHHFIVRLLVLGGLIVLFFDLLRELLDSPLGVTQFSIQVFIVSGRVLNVLDFSL